MTTAVVTGASTGLGRELASLLSATVSTWWRCPASAAPRSRPRWPIIRIGRGAILDVSSVAAHSGGTESISAF